MELKAHLRTARQMRQAKGGTTKSGLGQIVDIVSIREQTLRIEASRPLSHLRHRVGLAGRPEKRDYCR